MNNLQKLIRLRGLTIKAVADDTGLGYHSVQKNVKGIRDTYGVQEAIARSLNLDVNQAFGSGSDRYLKEHIKTAIKHRTEQHRVELSEQYLRNAA